MCFKQKDFEFLKNLLGEIPDQACYTVSRLAYEILKRVGYNCQVQRCFVIITDEIAKKLFDDVGGWENALKNNVDVKAVGGWSIGMGIPKGNLEKMSLEDDSSFHYVVYFPDEKEVLDLTFNQANRPCNNINAVRYWESLDKLPKCIYHIGFINDKRARGMYADMDAKKRRNAILAGVKMLLKNRKS